MDKKMIYLLATTLGSFGYCLGKSIVYKFYIKRLEKDLESKAYEIGCYKALLNKVKKYTVLDPDYIQKVLYGEI